MNYLHFIARAPQITKTRVEAGHCDVVVMPTAQV
jgi:hypothetical protein